MNKELLSVEEQNVHAAPGQHYDIGLTVGNAAQLIKLEPKKVAYLTAKHGQRIEPLFTEATDIGVLLRTPTKHPNPDIAELEETGLRLAQEQIKYMRNLSGGKSNLQGFTEADLKRELQRGKRTLLTPYANNKPFQESLNWSGLNNYELTISGVPTLIVEEIKGKKRFHERVSQLKDPNFAVPHYEIARVSTTQEKAKEMLTFENELYDAMGLPSYTRGVVLRPDYSDGGYGTCIVYEKNGKIKVSNDEDEDNNLFDSWEEALESAQAYLKRATEGEPDAEIVVSRFMKVTETPGISIFFMGNETSIDAVSLGFNTQIQHPETKACIGTETYISSDRSVTSNYEDRIADKAKTFILNLLQENRIATTEIRGPINFDVMLLDEEEQLLQKEITNRLRYNPQSLKASLKDKLIQYKQLEEPSEYFLAESNPRTTNYTGAIYAVLTAEGMPHTISNIREVIKQGIRTGDTVQVPDGVDIQELRNELLERFTPEKRDSGLIIMKTAPVEVGGNSNGHGREMSTIYTKIQNEKKLIPIFQKVKRKAA